MRVSVVTACAVCLLLAPATSRAQARGRVSFNVGQQATSTDFSQSGSFQDFVENATFSAAHQIDKDTFYDGGFTVRVAGGFAMGLAVSSFTTTDAVVVQASLPHPFIFNQPRGVTGSPDGFERTETGVHLLFGWLLPTTDRFEVLLSAGPSFLQVEQDFVERVNYTHAYPFDEAQFAGAPAERLKERATGFNAGADVTFKFTPNVGVGALIRYSKATLEAVGSTGGSTSFDVGGLHAGGGLRFIF